MLLIVFHEAIPHITLARYCSYFIINILFTNNCKENFHFHLWSFSYSILNRQFTDNCKETFYCKLWSYSSYFILNIPFTDNCKETTDYCKEIKILVKKLLLSTMKLSLILCSDDNLCWSMSRCHVGQCQDAMMSWLQDSSCNLQLKHLEHGSAVVVCLLEFNIRTRVCILLHAHSSVLSMAETTEMIVTIKHMKCLVILNYI